MMPTKLTKSEVYFKFEVGMNNKIDDDVVHGVADDDDGAKSRQSLVGAL